MAYTIIDRTQNGKRSSGNRAKFVKRVKATVREQVKQQVAEGEVRDLVSGKGKKINVPKKNLSQPTFNHGIGGRRKIVHPGNDRYTEGDRIDRPERGGGQGGGASKDGDGQDSFEFNLTFEEFLDLFFEDCELPNLEETVIAMTEQFEHKRAGFSMDGPPVQLNLERTLRASKGRRIGLGRKAKKIELAEAEIREAKLVIDLAEMKSAEPIEDPAKIIAVESEITSLRTIIKALTRKLRAVPFLDDTDLRYNRWEKVPVPQSQAVMFCLMDVSGSMGQWEKEMAKRYFMLMYLFLTRNYKKVDVVWIRHHSTARIVTEEEFFKDKDSGGTIVSSALDLMAKTMDEHYGADWNIYGSQVSDGDNWGEDSTLAADILIKQILPRTRYYTYIEVDQNPRTASDLWPTYDSIRTQFHNFQMAKVTDVSEIYPVFKQLFSSNRKKVKTNVKV